MWSPSLTDLRAFAAVARLRSFRAAADELGTSRSALSHAVASLERQLDVRLLHRTTRSVMPTEVGAAFLAQLAPALQNLRGAIDAVRGGTDRPAGTLRINANESACRWLLRAVIPGFLDRFPHVSLELSAQGRLVDIVQEGFDAGVRLRESVPQDMIAVPFNGDVRFLAVAAPAYLAAHGAPGVPDDLKRHRCIRQRLPSGRPYRWEFARGGNEVAIDVPGILTLDHNALMVEAAADGLGIAFVPEAAARPAIDAERLTVVLEEWCPPLPGLCLYYPANRHAPAALQAFINNLRSHT